MGDSHDNAVFIPRMNLTGKIFGRLTVTRYHGSEKHCNLWECRCVCGNVVTLSAGRLNVGNTKSCGCLKRDSSRARALAMRTHQRSNTPEWRSWRSMRVRCTDPKATGYKNWGGRGITVCPRWLGSFENFLADMGTRPTLAHTLERKDNDKGYSPDNCVWATRSEQRRNQRSIRIIEWRGQKKSVIEWAETAGVNYSTFLNRLTRMDMERAMTLPVQTHSKRKVAA